MNDLTAFQRDILYVLADLERPNGLRVKTALREYYDEDVHPGRLYPNLDDLIDDGFVEKGRIDGRTNAYTLTAKGRRLLAERRHWTQEVVEGSLGWTESGLEPEPEPELPQ